MSRIAGKNEYVMPDMMPVARNFPVQRDISPRQRDIARASGIFPEQGDITFSRCRAKNGKTRFTMNLPAEAHARF